MSVPEPLPPLAAIPPDIQTLADYERHAPAHMPAASWDHIQSGSGENLSLHANRADFARLRVMPRVLRDLRSGSTEIQLLGRQHAAPILLAPVAYQRLAHVQGELATATAATAMELTMLVSTLSSFTLEEIAGAAVAAAKELDRPSAGLWFQLYFQEDRDRTLSLVRRAEAAGYEAIVLTVDASVKRSAFPLPAGVEAANLRGYPNRRQVSGPGNRILFGTALAESAPRWEDVAWLCGETKLPVLIKGILAKEDAHLAVSHGARGIIVSNHGGRVLDGVPSALEVMPAIAATIGGAVPLLLDGGVRSGTDIVKALACGATAVLIGRPQVHALAVAGIAGVAHALHLLRGELELAMAQLGCARIAEIGAGQIFRGQ